MTNEFERKLRFKLKDILKIMMVIAQSPDAKMLNILDNPKEEKAFILAKHIRDLELFIKGQIIN